MVCEATFSSATRCIGSHQDELSASSVVPEMEAPASAPVPPGSGRGFSFWASIGGDRINQRHVIIAAGLTDHSRYRGESASSGGD